MDAGKHKESDAGPGESFGSAGFGKMCAILSTALSALAVWSWSAGVGDEFTFGPYPPIAPLTAAILWMISLAVFVQYHWPRNPAGIWYSRVAAIAGLLVGALVAVRRWAGWGSPFEQWLHDELLELGDLTTVFMASFTGALLAVASCVLWFGMRAHAKGAAGSRMANGLAVGVLLASGGQAVGFVIGAITGYSPGFSGVSVVATVTFMLLGAALAGLFSSAGAAPLAAMPLRRGRLTWLPLTVTSGLALIIGVLTAGYLRHEEQEDRDNAQDLLAAVAKLKQGQIVDWRHERMSDAKFFAQADFVSRDVAAFLAHPDSEVDRAGLQRWLDLLKAGVRYEWVALFDTNSVLRLASSPQPSPVPSVPHQLIAEALRGDQVLMSDLHCDSDDPRVHIDMVFPVFAVPVRGLGDLAPPPVRLGVVALRLDPKQFLYPLLRSWPTPSRTAETVLFHREGDDMVILNELRHAGNAPLTLRLSISNHVELAAVQAMPDQADPAFSFDYRGIPVLTVVRPVPDSPWFLAAEVDRDEIHAPLHRHAWLTLGLTAVLLTCVGLVSGLVAKRQEAEATMRELKLERNRRELAERVEHLMKHAGDAILVTDDKGHILEANDRALSLYGRSLAQMQAVSLDTLEADAPAPDLCLEKRLAASEAMFETWHRSKEGRRFPVEIGSNRVEIGGRQFLLVMVRDITARKRVEMALRESEERLQLFINHAPAALAMFDREMRYLAVSRRWLTDYQLGTQEILGRSHYEVFPEISGAWKAIHGRGLAGEVIREAEEYFSRADGTGQWLCWEVRPWLTSDGLVGGIVIFSDDITERKKAEEALRSERDFSAGLIRETPVVVCGVKPDGTTLFLNPAGEAVTGYASAEIVGKNWWTTFYPGEDQWQVTKLLRDFEGGNLKDYQMTLVTRSGERRVISWSSVNRSSDAGAVMEIVGYGIDVTERRRAEEMLRQSEERFRLITRTIDEVFWMADVSLQQMLYVSPGYERVWGRTCESLIENPKSFLDAVFPEDLPRVLAGLGTQVSGQPFDHEYRIVRPDGAIRWIWDRGYPVENPAGPVTHYLGVAQDITERKRAEAVSLESEHRLRYLSNNLPHCMLYQMQGSPDGSRRFTYVSEAVRRLHGVSPAEAMADAMILYRTVDQADQARLAEEERQAEASLSVFNTELRVNRLDGALRWVQLISTPRLLADGSVLWDGIEIDITERKAVQQQLRKLSSAVEQSPVSIVITDTKGRVEYVNSKFCALTGYTLDEMLGSNPRILKSGETSRTEYQHLWETITSGRVWHGEFHNRKKNGELFWELAAISPILDETGQITHFLAVKEDITERKRLESQFRQAQKMEAIGQLAGGVAHDFNNILAATMMQISLLQDRTDLDAELQEALAELDSHAKRAANLTRQLLLFSRRSMMQIAPLELNEVVENLLKMLRRIIGETIALEWQGKALLPAVAGDAGMLDQLVMNLVVNARDAMPDGGKISISTDVCLLDSQTAAAFPDGREGRFVRLEVADTGCGMSPAVLKRIFEPFFTTKEAGKGTGLGLATVYGIARQHRGWVWVESAVGRGSKFCVYLPAESGLSAAMASEQNQPMRRGHETILLVEDDSAVRRATGLLLRRCGYEVIEAVDGADALGVWEAHQDEVDLLLTDMVMPNGMSGLQLADELRCEKESLKVMIASGYSTDLLGRNDLAGRGIFFIQKPAPAIALAAAVRRCLDQA